MRIFAFMAEGAAAPSEKSYARIYELLSEAARRAKPGGFGWRWKTWARDAWPRGAVGRNAEARQGGQLRAFVDPNNAGEAGEQSFPDGYRKLDPARIFHVHLRDYKHRTGRWCGPPWAMASSTTSARSARC